MNAQVLLAMTVFTSISDIRSTLGAVLFEFTTVEYDWPNATLKVGGPDYIFVTVPRLRYKDGVPASLNTVHEKSPGSKEAVFRPYPDWDSNTVGNCNALQLPPSLEYDPRTGYLYVIDVGRVGIWSPTEPSLNLCPAKIVVFDTKQNGRIVRILDYVDPDHPTEVKYAYISDPLSEQICFTINVLYVCIHNPHKFLLFSWLSF
ncbi:unnamed protein product, partial [Candidula unifasciata]